jgi:hypothetical protein
MLFGWGRTVIFGRIKYISGQGFRVSSNNIIELMRKTYCPMRDGVGRGFSFRAGRLEGGTLVRYSVNILVWSLDFGREVGDGEVVASRN